MARRDLSRRAFLGASAVGVAAVGCGTDDDSEPRGVPVGVVGGDDVEASVRRAIELGGGLGVRPGDTVFIKPNAVHGSVSGLPGIVTSHEVLAAVIHAVRDMSPGHVIVGDRSARMFASEFVFNSSGLAEAALQAGADEVYPAPSPDSAPDDWVLMQPPAFEEPGASSRASSRCARSSKPTTSSICRSARTTAGRLSR